jgi:hypothetical protein
VDQGNLDKRGEDFFFPFLSFNKIVIELAGFSLLFLLFPFFAFCREINIFYLKNLI